MRNLVKCPSCNSNLRISQYHCPDCGIDINGEFEGCMFCNLGDEDRYFALVFLQTGGNIRDVEKVMGISYPTVKAKLAQLLAHLGVSSENHGEPDERHHFGDRYREKHRVREEIHRTRDDMKRVKREIRDKVRRDVRNSLKQAFDSMKDFHFDDPHFRADLNLDFGGDEGKSDEDVSTIISDLRNGKIDVNAALKRIRGEDEQAEETGETPGEARVIPDEGDPGDERKAGDKGEAKGDNEGGALDENSDGTKPVEENK